MSSYIVSKRRWRIGGYDIANLDHNNPILLKIYIMQISRNTLPGLKEKRYQQKKDIITFLYKMSELSKPEICRLTNMTTPTISRIIDELIEEGWVVDLGQGSSIGGKRPHIFSLAPDAAYILGVDWGRVQVKIAIFNLRKEIIGEIKIFPSALESGNEELAIRLLEEQIDQTIQELGINRDKIKVAGVSLPGLIDNEGNSFTYLSFTNPNLKEVLEQRLQIPTVIANDSKVMAMAEHTFGAAKNMNNVLCININEGIGMGMILNGKPYTGFKGMCGEFGHTRIFGIDEQCYCGKIGCLETVASGRALVRKAKQAMQSDVNTLIRNIVSVDNLTLQSVIEAAKQDDLFAIELLQKAGEKIGEGLSTLIHLFNPQMIVLGGEIVQCGDLITATIQQTVNKFTLTRMRNQCEVCLSPLQGTSTVLGSLMVVMKDLYYDDEDGHFSLY